MKRLMTIALLATTSVGFSSTAHATAAACGLEDDVPTSACTAAIAGQDRQMSGDLAITVADCDATTPTASASYAAFWRDNTLCEGDWNEGWGFGTSNAATCDDSTGYGLFIKTLWLIEHAHHTHPFFTSQEDIDPADYGWTTGEERWVQKMGNFLRNKMRYLNRSFTPVNGDEHIALTWPSFNMELFCLNWFTMPAVLRASTLIHEARHYDAGTDHVGSCPDGSCDPSLGYKGSYWFQISWLESFHRYADETKTSLAARTLARDGANWLVQHRIASSNGYYVPDRRAHTRYRSSYASSMAPRAIDMVASPRDDRAKLRLERCGAAMPVGGAMFLGLHAPVNGAYNSVDELGQGPITLMSPAMGQKDAFWYRRSNGGDPDYLMHFSAEDVVNPRSTSNGLCTSMGLSRTAAGHLLGSSSAYLDEIVTPLNQVRPNPLRTLSWGGEELAVFALEHDATAGPMFDRTPVMFLRDQSGNWSSTTSHPSFVASNTAAGGPVMTPVPVSMRPGRVDLFALFDDLRIRRRWCDDCSSTLSGGAFEPVWDWEEPEPQNPITTFYGFDAVSWGSKRLDLVTDTWSGEIFHRAWDDTGFPTEEIWSSLGDGGGFLANPVAVSIDFGSLDVFAIEAGSGHVMRKHRRPGVGWGPVSKSSDNWEDLGNPFPTEDFDPDSLAVITTGSGDIHVFLRPEKIIEGLGHLIFRTSLAPGATTFSGWTSIDTARFPGSALDISMGADKSSWVVGTSRNLFEWVGDHYELRQSGSFRTVDTSGSNPWNVQVATTTSNQIWRRHNGTMTQLWGGALDAAVGGNGHVWVVGTSGNVFSWNGTGWDTERVGNHLAIDVTADDEPVVVDTQNRIFRRQAGVWVQLNGLAKDVSVGADGTIWIVGTSNQVFRFNGTGFVLVHDVSATRVAGDPDGGVGFIASGSRIFIH